MTNLRLSEHFTLAEFERSATATACGINDSVPPQYIPTLQQLCKEVLEPLRRFVSGPIVISSGYRCNTLNVKVGGAYASQHTLGCSGYSITPDFLYRLGRQPSPYGLEEARRWFDFLELNTDFDQLIMGTSNGKDYWIHVSCRRNRKKNRHQVIRYLKK